MHKKINAEVNQIIVHPIIKSDPCITGMACFGYFFNNERKKTKFIVNTVKALQFRLGDTSIPNNSKFFDINWIQEINGLQITDTPIYNFEHKTTFLLSLIEFKTAILEGNGGVMKHESMYESSKITMDWRDKKKLIIVPKSNTAYFECNLPMTSSKLDLVLK